MRLWLLSVLASLTVPGCAQTQPQPSPAGAPPAVTPAPAPLPAPPAPAPAPPVRSPYAVSLASFFGDELDECADFDTIPMPGQEAAALAHRQKLVDGTKAGKDAGRTQMVLAGTCREQLSGRTELARCEVDRPGDAGRVLIASTFYRYATVGTDDAYLRDCLSLKGQWHANANALEHARLQGQMRRLEKMAEGN